MPVDNRKDGGGGSANSEGHRQADPLPAQDDAEGITAGFYDETGTNQIKAQRTEHHEYLVDAGRDN
jgi:hypothetical protein